MKKTHKNKVKKTKSKNKEDNIPSFLKSNYIIYTILFLIVLLSFYIRGIIPYESTFRNGITVFAMDDAVFHMRLVENLLANFPHRLTYDAFTNYPYGSVLTWGLAYSFIISILVIIFGVENINIIGAYVPAIMGALVSIPVFFIGKELLNKKTGLISAFIISILPGAFLQRSTLGFTDHHVAEVLFTTFFMMFLIFAFNRTKNIEIKNISDILKTPYKYSILSGIFLGLYLLTWTTGLLFAGIVSVFIIIQIFINYTTNKSNTPLLVITSLIYGISAIMVLPFVDLRNGFGVVFYSPTHIISLLSFIFICIFLDSISKKSKNMKFNTLKFVGISLVLFVGILMIIGMILPQFFANTFGSLDIVFAKKEGGGLTIGEAMPTNLSIITSIFGFNFIYALLSIPFVLFLYIREYKEKFLIILIWSILILIMLLSQNRWAYYFAINIAILSGLLWGYLSDTIGRWKDIKNINVWNISFIIFVIFAVGFLPFNNSPFSISQSTKYGVAGEGFYEWYESLTWMRNNTPDPGLDYYGTYNRPKDGEFFEYPDTAYGVMSWWDYGHIITYWGHRIPNASPFQSGIGGGLNHTPGASTFLIAQTEEEANNILKKLGINGNPGARYVVSNAYMAYTIQPVFAEWDRTNFGYFIQTMSSKGYITLPSEKYFNTMTSRLHILDTNGLKNYRLIHESNPNPYVRGGNSEIVYKEVYNKIINPNNKIPLENSGYVKIFEYVKGAKIVGNTLPNTSVTIENTIITNKNRVIQYRQTTNSNSEGKYFLIVPYSTLGSISNETQFDTKPIGPYTLRTIEGNILINITEEDVLYGGNAEIKSKISNNNVNTFMACN